MDFPFLSSTADTTTTPIQMTVGWSTSLTTIPRIKSFMGKRTPGVSLTLDSSITQEFEHRHKQALMWVQNIGTSPLTREEVYTAYCCMWRPSIECPFPITCFSKEQCCLLQKAFTGPFLSKMGLSSKTDRKLIFVPYHYSGFAIADTWVQQGIQHLQLLLGHFCQHDQVGNLHCINIETLQILIGHPQPPLSYPYKEIRHIAPPSWLTTTWEFLNDFDGIITLTDPWNLPLDRQGDCHLMPKVLSQLVNTPKPLLSKPDLQKINLSQIYLQALILSDIATSSGKKLTATSGKDTGHPASPLSPGPTKSDHPQHVGQSGKRLSTSYSQTQSGPPKFSHNIASIVGTQKPPLIHFGPPSLILPPPYSTLLYSRLAQHNSFKIYAPRNRFSYYTTTTHSALP